MKKSSRRKTPKHQIILTKIKKRSFTIKEIGAIVVALFLIFGFYFLIIKDLPLPTKLSSSANPQSTRIYDRNGELLYTIYGKKNQVFIPLSAVPKSMQEATIAIEDRTFYEHGAIDLKGITRATVSIVLKQQVQGGSTLTQQLVKNSLLNQERTILRKIKEVILAFATELIYPKNKILEMYISQSPYGGPAYGVESASEMYFGKHAKDLTLAESALLAGLPQSPTAYSPFGARPELAKKRQLEVLKAMREEKYITEKEEQKAAKEELKYNRIANDIKAPHFVLYIKDLLITKYGEKTVEEGGLKVTTSIDVDIQKYAEEAVLEEVSGLPKYYRVSNGAALVTNPATGEILAMVGSRDYFNTTIDGNVNITTSLRQPGSSIKPINYAVGLIKKYSGATALIDKEICYPNQGGRQYCPLNYDGKWHGLVQLRYALGNSLNIPAVKMLKLNGIDAMIATASAMGISTFTHPENYGLSLTLGGAEVKMTDMATAFGVFANGGYRIDLHPVLKIVDKQNKILEEYKPLKSPIFGKKVLPDGVAFIISDILSDNGARLSSFGDNSQLRIPKQIVSVKTGTTNDYRDNWTIGYTPSFLVASWVGNNDNTPMSGLVSGVTGAAPIWNNIMSYLLKDKPQEALSRPADVIQKQVCSDTGLFTQAGGTCPTRLEYFIRGTEKTYGTIANEGVLIDKTTGDLAKKNQIDNTETKEQTIFTDATGDKYCVSCPHPTPTPSITPTP